MKRKGQYKKINEFEKGKEVGIRKRQYEKEKAA